MKRFLILLLSLVILLGLVACGSDDDKADDQSSPAAPAPQQAEEEAPVEEAPAAQEPAEPAGEKTLAPGVPEYAKDDFVGEIPEVEKDAAGEDMIKAIDFSLTDQFGERHTLEDYKGKVVILNFWQSWCGPCLAEMPDFQKVYEDLGANGEDVVILGVSSPKSDMNTRYFQEPLDFEGIKSFMEEKGYSYPSLMDFDAQLYSQYGIMSFPTTFVIKPDGYLLGMVPGSIAEADLRKFIDMAREAGDGEAADANE